MKPVTIDGGEVRVNFWDLSGTYVHYRCHHHYHHYHHYRCHNRYHYRYYLSRYFYFNEMNTGHPEFFEIRNEFYKDTQGALLVYDVTNEESFAALDTWMAEAVKYGCNPKV